MSGDSIHELVDHLFRHKAGQMVAILTRIFGIENLQLAEDVVQDTLLQALQQWAYRGVPENPGGWLTQVAKNRALDILRRQAAYQGKIQRLAGQTAERAHALEVAFEDVGGDDQLTMMFLGCHPALPVESQIALVLKTVGGFGVLEIARAFLISEATVAQRIVRAKRKIREQTLTFDLPPAEQLAARLDAVLLVIYLIFNEGYNASHGDALIRQELCSEAVRLGSLLAEHPLGQRPKVHALMALLLLQASRLPARLDESGDLLLLPDQDRSLWNRAAIGWGIYHLQRAASGDELSEYHLQAGIAACHAAAPDYEATDWQAILSYYDQLVRLNPSPIFALNRAVALAMVAGWQAGIDALNEITGLDGYYLLPATFGALHARAGNRQTAADCFRRALALTSSPVEQRFLTRKLAECEAHPVKK